MMEGSLFCVSLFEVRLEIAPSPGFSRPGREPPLPKLFKVVAGSAVIFQRSKRSARKAHWIARDIRYDLEACLPVNPLLLVTLSAPGVG